jgi:hypothetical protein
LPPWLHKKFEKEICMEDFGLQKNKVNTSIVNIGGAHKIRNKINSTIPP